MPSLMPSLKTWYRWRKLPSWSKNRIVLRESTHPRPVVSGFNRRSSATTVKRKVWSNWAANSWTNLKEQGINFWNLIRLQRNLMWKREGYMTSLIFFRAWRWSLKMGKITIDGEAYLKLLMLLMSVRRILIHSRLTVFGKKNHWSIWLVDCWNFSSIGSHFCR